MKKFDLKKKPSTAVIALGCSAIALFAGVGIGQSTQPEPEVRTETKTVTEEVTVEVERTPESCLDAVKSSADVIDLGADALIISADVIEYAVSLDAAGINAQNSKLDVLLPKYQDALADWESSSKLCITASEGQS